MAERLCAHEPCHCEPEPGKPYCGDRCARAASGTPREAGRCACGHPECRPENVPPDQPPPVAQP